MDQPKPTIIEEKDIIDTLMQKEQVQRLEHIIHIDSQRLEDMGNIFGRKLDYGPRLGLDEVKQEFPEIKKEVDSFLGVKWVRHPKIEKIGFFQLVEEQKDLKFGYQYAGVMLLGSGTLAIGYTLPKFINGDLTHGIIGTFLSAATMSMGLAHLKEVYSWHKNAHENQARHWSLYDTIYIPKTNRVRLKSNLAHEYAHHVQSKKGVPMTKKEYNAFTEGHARGVARHLDRILASRENNPAYLHHSIDDYSLAELKITYCWLASKLNMKPSQSLLETRTSRDEMEKALFEESQKPTVHALGNSFFYAQELVQGNSIYRDALKGEFQVK